MTQAATQTKHGPHAPTATELKRVGVSLTSSSSFNLQCDRCKAEWAPEIPAVGKRFHRGYWHCPNGCNLPGQEKGGKK